MTVRLPWSVGVVLVACALLSSLALGAGRGPSAAAAEETPSEQTTVTPSPSPTPTTKPSPTPKPSPSPSQKPTPSPSPSPSPAPTPSPSPTAAPESQVTEPESEPDREPACPARGDDVGSGDLDRDCDGTLLLSEQAEPVSLRRTVAVVPGEDAEDRFEPTDFVDGTLVDFDPVSREGGTVARGSLIYSPPDGFVGSDRFTFFMEDEGLVRQVEVLVEVEEGQAASEEPTEEVSVAAVTAVDQDAVDRALAASAARTPVDTPRWDPAWMVALTLIATLLLGAAAAWWLLVIVRVQDRMLGE